MRAVIDTNVIVSRHLSAGGTPWQILARFDAGGFTLLISTPLLEELGRVLSYPHLRVMHKLGETQIEDVVNSTRAAAEFVATSGTLHVIASDPSDNMVLECAVMGNADVIVTGDKKHLLPLGSYEGVPVVSPADFLAMLDDAHSAE
jgi:putative PIN family toxin of toxin-antitoxin system